MRVTDLLRVTHLLSAHQAVDVSQKVAEHRIADVCNVRPARPTAYPVLGEVVQLQLQLCKLLICGLPLGLQECKFRPSPASQASAVGDMGTQGKHCMVFSHTLCFARYRDWDLHSYHLRLAPPACRFHLVVSAAHCAKLQC